MERRQAEITQKKEKKGMALALENTLSITSTSNQESASDSRKVVV